MPNYLLAKDENILITPSGYKKDVKKLVSSNVVFPGRLVIYKYVFLFFFFFIYYWSLHSEKGAGKVPK